MKSDLDDYNFLIFVFKLDTIDNDIIQSYATHDQLVQIGLDPSRDMDIKINHKGYNICSVNLSGKFKDKYLHYKRDISLCKLFDEL